MTHHTGYKESEVNRFPSTDEHCPNSLNGGHDKKHNARETHFVCGNCSRLLGEIPEDEKNPIPSWRLTDINKTRVNKYSY